jgi:hypothetical protein
MVRVLLEHEYLSRMQLMPELQLHNRHDTIMVRNQDVTFRLRAPKHRKHAWCQAGHRRNALTRRRRSQMRLLQWLMMSMTRILESSWLRLIVNPQSTVTDPRTEPVSTQRREGGRRVTLREGDRECLMICGMGARHLSAKSMS